MDTIDSSINAINNGVTVSAAARGRLFAAARGRYQRTLAIGRLGWSDAALAGEAKKWTSRYGRSRENLLRRARCTLIRGPHGRLAAVTDEEFEQIAANPERLPSSWHSRRSLIAAKKDAA